MLKQFQFDLLTSMTLPMLHSWNAQEGCLHDMRQVELRTLITRLTTPARTVTAMLRSEHCQEDPALRAAPQVD
jgi:hypothetical protein